MTNSLAPTPVASRLVQWAGVIAWVGFGTIGWSLAAHTSRGAVILDRYSRAYALLLAVFLIAFVTIGLTLLLRWQQWPGLVVSRLNRVPGPLAPVLIAIATPALAWLLIFGSTRYGFIAQPLLQLGSAVLYAGLALMFYGAVDSATLAQPALLDRLLASSRAVLAGLLFGGAASLFLASLGWRRQTVQAWGLVWISLLAVMVVVATLRRAWTRVELPEPWRVFGSYLYRARTLIAAILIVGYVFAIYSPGLQQALLGADELRYLSFVYGRSPWVGFVEIPQGPIWYGANYRPLYALQAWTFYTLFGVNYSGGYLVQVAVLALSCILVYVCVLSIGQSTSAALLAGLLFASHSFVSDLVSGWTYDPGTLTGVVAVAVAILLWRWAARWQSYLALLVLLLIAALSRENGIAIGAAVVLYLVFAALVRQLPLLQAAIMLGVCALSAVLYLLLRYIGTQGALIHLAAIGGESGIFFRLYSLDEINAFSQAQRLGLYAYTALANLIGNFVPVFGPEGTLWQGPLGIWLIPPALLGGLTAIIGFDHQFARRWADWSIDLKRQMLLALTIALAGLGLAGFVYAPLIRVPPIDQNGLVALQFAFHATLSFAIAYAAMRSLRWSAAHRAIAAFAIGLIVAGSLVAFPYYRYRTQYLSYFGWLLLLAIVIYFLRDGAWHKYLRRAMLISAAALVVVNGARVYTSLPLSYLLPANFQVRGPMCDPQVPAAVVETIATRYQLDLNALQACRAQSLSPEQDHAVASR